LRAFFAVVELGAKLEIAYEDFIKVSQSTTEAPHAYNAISQQHFSKANNKKR